MRAWWRPCSGLYLGPMWALSKPCLDPLGPYLGPHLGSYLGPYPGPVEAPLGLCGCPPHLSHVYVHAYQAAAAAAVADEEDEESEEGCLPRGPLQASQDF